MVVLGIIMNQAKKKNIKRNSIQLFIGIILGSILFAFFVVPFFQRKTEGFDEETQLQPILEIPTVLGVDFNNSAAYHYWYAPNNSIGINQWKNVNFSPIYNK